MPQNPILGAIVSLSKKLTAAGVVKAVPGFIATVIIEGVPTAGALTLNDVATLGGAGSGNQIVSIPFGSLVSGQSIVLMYPAKAGIVVSAIPTGVTDVKVQYA